MSNSVSTSKESETVVASSQAILVPLDGSPAAESAIPIAREAARILGATIRLLHVADTALEHKDLLQAVMLQPESVMGAVLEGASGPPAQAIVRAASEAEIVLIVMSATGWTGDADRPLGHVAESVLRQTTSPVILVRPEVGKRFEAEHRRLKRLLLPLDGAPITAAALGPAVEIACMCEAELDVLHVVGPGIRANGHPGTLSVPRYQDQPHLSAQRWTREFLRRFCNDFPKQPEHVLVRVGDPGKSIVGVARELHSDLIVIAWKAEFDGNRARTARAVLRNAPCPVLFLRVQSDVRGDAVAAGAQPQP
ncbi:MAG TPA: universal stress protein [Chloroflexota bacterium]|nr:universal stress protein [Chloroflexota bacterium]